MQEKPTRSLSSSRQCAWGRLSKRGRDMGTNLRKTGESSYEVMVDEQVIGQVWNWHGSWSSRVDLGLMIDHRCKSSPINSA